MGSLIRIRYLYYTVSDNVSGQNNEAATIPSKNEKHKFKANTADKIMVYK